MKCVDFDYFEHSTYHLPAFFSDFAYRFISHKQIFTKELEQTFSIKSKALTPSSLAIKPPILETREGRESNKSKSNLKKRMRN